MRQSVKPERDVVLIGGGHAHALLLQAWGMRPRPDARLTLVDPHPKAPYTGMLPGHIAGHYALGELEIDLARLARHAGARLVSASATGIDRSAKKVMVEGRTGIGYDLVSINAGSVSSLAGLPGFQEHANPAKPLGAFAIAWDRFVAEVGSGRAPPEAAVVGGGVAGVELALAMDWRLRSASPEPRRIALIEAGSELLPELRGGRRRRLARLLRERGIAVRLSESAGEFHADGILLASGTKIGCGFAAVAAGAAAPGWLRETGLELHEGFVSVDRFLRSVSDESICAAGDCAHLGDAPLPKAGVYAVRQAPVLLRNLRASLSGGARKPFRPQRDFLRLVSTGDASAVGQKFGIGVEGPWVWRFKDRIDRRFMRKLTELPAMGAAVGNEDNGSPEEHALCGGCGSKLGRKPLLGALRRLPEPSRSDVLFGGGDDAAALRFGKQVQVVSTDHLRPLTGDFWLHARISALHALGDVWAMGAKPQSALAHVVLPEMPDRMLESTLEEIMDAAASAFRAEGADVVGGHTSLGAEMLIGFAVTGIADDPIRKGGARPGDRIIATRAIGSGTILAGEMRGLADGRDVIGALNEMARSSGSAAGILSSAASAMTDVSGFGLAGHLMEMLEQSGVSARLDLDSVRVLAGAAELAAKGVRSVIWPANRGIAERMSLPAGPRADLLFDPQTAGGLLATVPASDSASVLELLRRAGESAAEIGEITPGEPFIRVERGGAYAVPDSGG